MLHSYGLNLYKLYLYKLYQKKCCINYSCINYTVIFYTGIIYTGITYTTFKELQNYRIAFRTQSIFCKNRIVIATPSKCWPASILYNFLYIS